MPNTLGVNSQEVSYQQIHTTIIAPKCLSCHSDTDPQGNVSYSSYAATMASLGSVVPYTPYQSKFYQQCINRKMPPDTPLPNNELQMIYNWIALGAKNN